MIKLDVSTITDKANFHGKYVAVSRVITSKIDLWKNVVLVAHQSMPFYNKDWIERMVTELQHFLILKALSGDVNAEILSPSSSVDEVWHIFILFTREYAEVCSEALVAAKLPVGLIHHNPLASLPGDEANKKIRYQNTRDLYQAVFSFPIPNDMWPVGYEEESHRSVNSVPSNQVNNSSSSSGGKSSQPLPVVVPVEPEIELHLSLLEVPDRTAHCKVKPSTKLQKVFDDFMESLQIFGLSFYFNGEKLLGNNTVNTLNWSESDMIIVKR